MRNLLREMNLLHLRPEGENGGSVYYATDGPERFARVGSIFLGHPLDASDVHLVDL